MASAGAGRPADRDGLPVGQWTPELLADEISRIDGNREGIELRTVQLWFQDNDRGISSDNIRWLARIFGCGDPEASGAWQVELSAANRRLAAKRKLMKSGRQSQSPSSESVHAVESGNARVCASIVDDNRNWRGFDLAQRTEALFGSQSSMALPLVVFTGACALALISFTLNVHSVVYTPESGPPKQVGFLWAPNWTITFLAVLPLYLALVIDFLRSWKEEWRPMLVDLGDPTFPVAGWELRLAAASYSFWAMFFITVIVASGYNWTATHLVPLLKGDPGNWPVDWGRIAILRSDLISVSSAVLFTGLVFLYNGMTAYLFFSGLIFLHLMKHDYLDLVKGLEGRSRKEGNPDIEGISLKLMNGIFRCTSLGVVITLLMKLQSGFLQSNSTNMVEWLIADFRSLFGNPGSVAKDSSSFGTAPGFYYSFFCLLAIVGTFMNASIRFRWILARLNMHQSRGRILTPSVLMNAAMALLVISYFVIGVVQGFTIFLLFSLALTGYLHFKPASTWNQGFR